MSYMALYGVWPREKTEEILKLGNSWGGLTFIWETMAGKYLGIHKSYSHPDKGWMQLAVEFPSPLWDLYKDPCIPEDFRLVFMWGFDRVYVAKKNYTRMAKAIRRFLVAFPPKSENVNHWDAIATFLENNPDVPGIGIYGTSCGDNLWIGNWNDEKEDYDPLDWEQVYECCELIDALEDENVPAL
jgi:hypothetical protein